MSNENIIKSQNMKMTNKDDTDGDPTFDPRLADFLAVHLVRQILDDAYIIANSALESETWRYESLVTNDKLCETVDDEEASSKEGSSDIVNENKMEHAANVVATSTPQKVTDEMSKCVQDCNLIGQGDEELQMRHQNELATSMFINHLFDMSEVETVIVCDDTEMVQSKSDSNEVLTEAMTMIMDSYINIAMAVALKPPSPAGSSEETERSSDIDLSEYSFLSDAFEDDIGRDLAFYLQDSDDLNGTLINEGEVSHFTPGIQITEIVDEDAELCMERNEVARYENAYLSLNRDYEQCSEDDGNVILDDPKGMTLQEIELLTANTSNENVNSHDEIEPEVECPKSKELTATSAVSAASKRSLVSRCRSQGARLLACLRGWWRRRTPGKRKEQQYRISNAARGLCPLSPDARRRAASLIDQRHLRTPSPSEPVIWKFNTLNEAVVNSTRWKEYTFDVKPDECGEY